MNKRISGKIITIVLVAILILNIATVSVTNTRLISNEPHIYKSNDQGTRTFSKLNVNTLLLPHKIDPKILDRDYLAKRIRELEQARILEENETKLILKVSDTAKLDDIQKVLERYYASILKVYEYMGVILIRVPTDDVVTVQRLSIELASLSDVESIWFDDAFKINTTLFDTSALLGFAISHGYGINGSGIKVAILDTGIDASHPELNGSLIAWTDFINNQQNPYDDNGHGTFVAGIIAARGVVRFMDGEKCWHTILYDNSGEFNYPGPANLTYEVNVTGYSGFNLTVEWLQRYSIEQRYDKGEVLYRFDNTSWTLLATYTGSNFSLQHIQYNITIPVNATKFYISFIYEPDYSVQRMGWFIDDIRITVNGTTLLYDDVEGPPPQGLIEAKLWVRTTDRLVGVAPGASLMVAKVCSSSGGCPYDAILNGIYWAVLGPDQSPNTGDEADVISMSLGGPAYSYDILMQTIDWAYSMNVTCVIAAGNSGPGYKTVESPGAARGAIAVGASTKLNTIAYFSSWGPSPIDYTIKPDIVAPGRYIVSTYSAQAAGYPSGAYVLAVGSGTSFSTPHVSGIVALIKQAHPTWTPEEIRAALVSTATEHIIPNSYTPSIVNPYIEGGGLPNINRAIETEFLPVPAIVSFGQVVPKEATNLSSEVLLKNYGTSPLGVTVISVELYDDQGNDYSSWIQEPIIGESWNITPGSSAILAINVTVPQGAGSGYYWGRILLQTSDGQVYQVILGFTILPIIHISGTVYDVSTELPLSGVNVTVIRDDTGEVLDWCITDSEGRFNVTAIGDTPIRILGNFTGYYLYMTTSLRYSSNVTGFEIYMTPRYGYYDKQVLVVVDTEYGGWSLSYDPSEDLTILNGTLGIVDRIWHNSKQGVAYDAIMSGDFPVVVWLSDGIWSPVNDIYDYIALISISQENGRGILLEGGDIGWYHSGDYLMWYVAHAQFYQDLAPDAYQLFVSRSHPLTSVLPSNFTIDSTNYGYPDVVIPVNNGKDIVNWTDYNGSAIVVYDGRVFGGARTVYIAFALEAMESSLRTKFTNISIIWLLDQGSPIYTGHKIEVTYNYKAGKIIAYWQPFIDPPFNIIVEQRVYLNGTLIATLPSSVTSIDLTSYVAKGKLYNITIEAIDLLNQSTTVSALFKIVPPGQKGEAVGFSEPGIFEEDLGLTFPGKATVSVRDSPASIQVYELNRFQFTPPTPEKIILYSVDFSIQNPENFDQVVLTLKYPLRIFYLNKSSVKPYWWDGSTWREFSNFTIDTSNNVLTIYIDNTTTPSLSDLTGTPIIITGEKIPVGGEASMSHTSQGPALELIIAIVTNLTIILTTIYFIKSKTRQ